MDFIVIKHDLCHLKFHILVKKKQNTRRKGEANNSKLDPLYVHERQSKRRKKKKSQSNAKKQNIEETSDDKETERREKKISLNLNRNWTVVATFAHSDQFSLSLSSSHIS